MLVENQIDQLVSRLTKLKQSLTENISVNEKNFDNVLQSTISNYKQKTDIQISQLNPENEFPEKVDLFNSSQNYSMRQKTKPNMRELMSALSGATVEELYERKNGDYQKYSNLAHELLYAVIGDREDRRDWNKILSSSNVLSSVREETGKMYNPKVDIISDLKTENLKFRQKAIIKDGAGTQLRVLEGKPSYIAETLKNYGATTASLPNDLDNKIDKNNFDQVTYKALLEFTAAKSLDITGRLEDSLS